LPLIVGGIRAFLHQHAAPSHALDTGRGVQWRLSTERTFMALGLFLEMSLRGPFLGASWLVLVTFNVMPVSMVRLVHGGLLEITR